MRLILYRVTSVAMSPATSRDTQVASSMKSRPGVNFDDTRTRVAVVTGGGRGIGRGITLALADLGFALVVNYRSDQPGRDDGLPRSRRTLDRPRRSRFARTWLTWSKGAGS